MRTGILRFVLNVIKRERARAKRERERKREGGAVGAHCIYYDSRYYDGT